MTLPALRGRRVADADPSLARRVAIGLSGTILAAPAAPAVRLPGLLPHVRGEL
jgi:hypothetical protein